MNRITTASFGVALLGLIFLFSVSVSAQRSKVISPVGPLWEDTAINPHDFTDEYYEMHGILGREIIGRRTGTDGLSVFSNSSNPYHTNVRIIATIPGYDQLGNMFFWYPLGELQDSGFTPDKVGVRARETAKLFPIYVFPNTKIVDYRAFANTRQASLMDNTLETTKSQEMNPLGLHEIVIVNYTEKALGKEGFEMMNYMMKKNGSAADDTPLIRTMDDIDMLLKHEMITVDPLKAFGGDYAIGPMLFNPTNGVIARDAYLWMTMKDDRPLPAEDLFVWQFYCLQKTGNWCSQ